MYARPVPPVQSRRSGFRPFPMRRGGIVVLMAAQVALLVALAGCAGISAEFRDPDTGARIGCLGLDGNDPAYTACVESLTRHGYERTY